MKVECKIQECTLELFRWWCWPIIYSKICF